MRTLFTVLQAYAVIVVLKSPVSQSGLCFHCKLVQIHVSIGAATACFPTHLYPPPCTRPLVRF